MITWCSLPELTITSDIEPCTTVRKPLPSDTVDERKDKHDLPYLNKTRVLFDVNYLGEQYCILIEKGFKWDGTTCLGLQHLPFLLNASCVHDKICNYHNMVNQDRQLSTMIFREIGIASGGWRWFMWGAYYVVDFYQKYFGRDIYGKRWQR